MKLADLENMLTRVRDVSVAVYGDFCLDVYWMLDPAGSEISVETGIQAESVAQQQYSPGGAGNIVANMAALKPGNISCIGSIGDDIFGKQLITLLQNLGADTAGMKAQSDFATYTYIKRYLHGVEQPRIDFGVINCRNEATDRMILNDIGQALSRCDALVINQQVVNSIPNPSFIDGLLELFRDTDKVVLLDSRHYPDQFHHVYFKINRYELAHIFGYSLYDLTEAQLTDCAYRLYARNERPVFVTQGPEGIWVIDEQGLFVVPGIPVKGDTDPVGAGDTVVSALALLLGAGLEAREAAVVANLAAAVTVRKLFQTGTATPQEIVEMGQNTYS